MKSIFTFRAVGNFFLLLFFSAQLFAQSFTETFTDVATLTSGGGWVVVNNTVPVGTTTWRQGENTSLTGGFLSFDNALVSGFDYALCDFNTGGGTAAISNWLISPSITTLSNGDTISFYTRTTTGSIWPDNLQLRVSSNGTSTNVGTTATSVGDFSTLLLDINPTLAASLYPETWTLYSVVISGLPAGNLTGRLAFRYVVANGGPSGTNSIGVGVDVAHYGNQVGGGSGSLTTGTISPNTYCVGSSISVPFTSTGLTFLAGNVFTAQLSDALGSFASPTAIGTLTSTATSGTVSATIPANAAPGGFYRVRVVASNPNTIGSQNSASFYISRNYPPTLFANPSASVCSGGTVTLSAVPFERFYGFEAISGNFVRFNAGAPGTLVNVGSPTTADYFAGDFGPDGYYVIDNATGNYGKVDLQTGVVTNLGVSTPAPGYSWTGLAWNPARSNFYATAVSALGDTSKLYHINLPNGSATFIGDMTNVSLAIWIAIANNGATYVLDIANDNIYGISLTTGAGTLVGNIGFDANFAQGADFDPTTGVLYMAAYNNTTLQAELRTVNTTTGASTLVGLLGANPANTEIDGLAIAGYSSYLWSTGSTASSINITTGATYTVTVTNPQGCTASASQVVTVGAASASISPANPTICNNGSVLLTASGANTYLWSTGASTASINVSAAGPYTVTATGNGGCTATATVNVVIGTAPIASITPSNPTLCAPNTVSLTASGGGSYLWSTGGTTASISVTNTGVYTVTVTGNGGCTATATVSVTPGTPPTATISPSSPTLCSPNSVSLTASGGNSYLWSTGGTSASISVTNTGSYTVTVTGNGGCTATATVSVAPATPPSVGITPSNPAVCGGGSVNLTASGAATYLWSTGGTNASINVTNTGLYTVTATANNGCSASASVTVGTGTPPTAIITPGGNTVFCQGSSVMLTAGGGSTYSWSTGALTAAVTASSSGLYVVTVTAANGCTATASQSVTVNPAPNATINASGATTLCPGGNVTLTATGGITYNWSSGQNTDAINVSTANTYTVTVTNANTCTSTASQVVTIQNTNASITPSGSTQICPNGSVTLTASQGSGYLWSGGQTSASIVATTAGNYTVTVTFAGGCSASATQQVSSANAPTAIITPSGSTTVCNGQSVSLTASGGGSYAWSSGPTTALINVNTGGTYTVTVSNSSGCTATASQTIVQSFPTASISPSGNTTFCSGSSINLTANGGSTYSWSGGQNTATILVSATGIYTVTATDVNGCTASASQTVVVNVPSAVITPSGPTTFCPGGNVTLSANSGSGFLWSTGSQNISINVLTGGTYTVTVTDGNNCTASASQVVTVDANPTATITPSGNATICSDGSEVLTATSGLSYAWSTGATSQSVTVTTGGIYNVTVTLGAGCSASATQTVVQLPAIGISGVTSPSAGTDGAVNITLSNGVPPFVFSWSNAQSTEDINNLPAGNYTVTATDNEGCSATASFNVAVGVSIVALENVQQFSVYPNPAQHFVRIDVRVKDAALFEVRVVDMYGKLIYVSKQYSSVAALELDASLWSAGVYNIEVSSSSFSMAKKLVVFK